MNFKVLLSTYIASVADLVDATKATLQDYQSDDMWEKVYAYVMRIQAFMELSVKHKQSQP